MLYLVTDHESPAIQRMIAMMSGSARMDIPPPTLKKLEINPDHAVMRGLFATRKDRPELAKMVVEQVSSAFGIRPTIDFQW